MAFLGESPGTQEKKKGRPFVGPSGQLLDKIFEHHDIRRDESLLTNAALCNYEDTDKASLPGAIEACRPRLLHELEECNTHTAVTLGNAAAKSLLNTNTGITKLRGGDSKQSDYIDVKVVPTFHPAYTLRDQGKFPLLLSDVGKIKPRKASWIEPNTVVIEDTSRALSALNNASTDYPYVLDVETGKEKEEQYSRTTNLLCVGLGSTRPDHNNRVVVIGRPAIFDTRVQDSLIRLISKTGVIGQNAKFDIGVLQQINAHDLNIELVFDTMLASYCLDPKTKIMMSNLRWVNANELKVGDKIAAFDSQQISFHISTNVLGIKKQKAITYQINTDCGSVIASASHLWPVKRATNNDVIWRTTEFLFFNGQNYRIPFLVKPWEIDNTYEGGYIAGILDGEGNLYKKEDRNNWRLTYSQNKGSVSEYAKSILNSKGFELSEYQNGDKEHYQFVFKTQEDVYTALGMFRPKRFENYFELVWQGKRKRASANIESIKYLGEQDVIGIETEEGTLIANGFLSHNSLNENPGVHSLKYMGVEYLGTPHWEEEIKPYLKAPKDPPEIRQPALDYVRNVLSEGPQLRSDILGGDHGGIQDVSIKRAASELGVVEYKNPNATYKPHQIRWTLDSRKGKFVATPEADGSYASIPPKILHKYNAFDVQVTRTLHSLLSEWQAEDNLTEFNKHLMVMANALMRVERNGLQVDYEFNSKLYEDFSAKIEALRQKLPTDINVGSIPQLKAHIEDAYGYSPESTGEETITAYINDPTTDPTFVEFCQNLLEYRRWTKLRSTYVTSIRKQALDNNGKVLPTFKIDQATTGRLASKSPNVQQMPRQFDIKRQFVPSRSDRVYIHADYSQLELRVIVWMAQDENMRELFNNPSRDVFDELTLSVYGISKDEFSYLKETQPEQAKEMRVVVKSFCYGILYGRSPQGIASDPKLNITVEEATARHRVFKEQVPKILKFQESVINQIHHGQDLVNVFGRRRRFHLITHQNRHDLEKQAMAYLPQSTASDICVTALSRLPNWMDPRNIVHDDIICEAPRSEAIKHGETLARIMVETAEEYTEGYVKFEADYEIGENWQDMVKPSKWTG